MEKIKGLGLKKVLLANAAQHSQYFGKDKNLSPFNDKTLGEHNLLEAQKKFEDFKALATEEGFSQENASVFCISHIVCKTLKEL